MSKETVLKCDICKRDSSQMAGDVKILHRKFKIKEFGLKESCRNPWKNIDICTACLYEIRESVLRKNRDQRETEGI